MRVCVCVRVWMRVCVCLHLCVRVSVSTKRRAKAEANLDTLMLSDAPLLLPPSVLALSALREAFRGKVEGKLMGYMSRVVTRSNSVQTQEENGQGKGADLGCASVCAMQRTCYRNGR